MKPRSVDEILECHEQDWCEAETESNRIEARRITKHSLYELIMAEMPKKVEVGEMRYCGCNPDFDRGGNQAIDQMTERLKKLFGEE